MTVLNGIENANSMRMRVKLKAPSSNFDLNGHFYEYE